MLLNILASSMFLAPFNNMLLCNKKSIKQILYKQSDLLEMELGHAGVTPFLLLLSF